MNSDVLKFCKRANVTLQEARGILTESRELFSSRNSGDLFRIISLLDIFIRTNDTENGISNTPETEIKNKIQKYLSKK